MGSARLERLALGAALFVVPLIYWPFLKDYTLPPKLLAWQIPLLVVACGFVIVRKPFESNRILVAAGCYLLVNAVSLLWATDPVLGLVELVKLLTGYCFVAILIVRDESEFETYVDFLIGAATVSALIGILQHLSLAPWVIPSAGLPSGTVGFRNIAAMVTMQALPFALWRSLGQDRPDWIRAASLILLVAFLIHTRTRGAWIGAFVGLTVLAFMYARHETPWKVHARSSLIVVVLALGLGWVPSQLEKVGPQSIDEKKTTVVEALASITASGGDRGRLVLWGRTVDMILDHPASGVGLGNWSVQYPRYDGGQLVTYVGSPARPHNDWLWIASELGLPGLLAFIWLIYAACRVALDSSTTRSPSVAIPAVSSLAALLTHSCFSFPRDRITPTLIFWFCIGCTAALEKSRAHRGPTARLIWPTAAVTLILSITVTTRIFGFESDLYSAGHAEARSDWANVSERTADALSRGRLHAEALHLHGFALNNQRRYAESVAHYKRHGDARPHDVQYLNGWAIALQNTGDFEGARSKYVQARSLVSSSTDLDYNLATLLIQMRRPSEAIPLLQGVIESEGRSGDLLFHLGNAQALAGDTDAAVLTLEAASTLRPQMSQIQFVLGELYVRLGRRSDAREALNTFLSLHRREDGYTRRVRELLESLPKQE